MPKKHLSSIDLDLLPVLEALLRRRNVTRAGQDVGLSQPAMSRALRRLRELFDDELLTRQQGYFVLTPRAKQLEPEVEAALGKVRSLFSENNFDPATVKKTVRIAALDANAILILPDLMYRLGIAAPGVNLHVEGFGANTIEKMQKGEIDFAFGVDVSELPPTAESMVIGHDRLVLVTRKNHALSSGVVFPEDFVKFPHVAISIFGDGKSAIDAQLAKTGLSRDIALITQQCTIALAVISKTDIVGSLSQNLVSRFADDFSISFRKSPIMGEKSHISLIWNRMNSNDEFYIWIRGLIREVCLEIYPELI